MDNKELLEAIGRMFEKERENTRQMIREETAPINERLDRMEDRLVRVEITQENIVIPQIRTIAETHGDVVKGFKRLDAMNEKIEDIQNTVEVLKLVVKKNNP